MWRYAFTIFLSAFLLFLVQPLIGKYILPWFGGGPGVWTACLLFFQAALLAGYAYAHVINRLPRSVQMWLHLCVLAIAITFLPIVPHESWKPSPDQNPAWRILILLTATIGVPFAALSATGPLLQAWFSRTHAAVSPYRLYALSNVGSLLALVSYPFVVEPMMTRRAQGMAWSAGFVFFALAAGYCAVKAARPDERGTEASNADSRPERRNHVGVEIATTDRFDVMLWLLLPACAVVMLMSVTSLLSDEVAPMPFLWVLTLAAYLLTFIICFEWPRLYFRPVFATAAIASPWIVAVLLRVEQPDIAQQIVAYVGAMFFSCMVCHGELHRLRPEPQRLTGYYLFIAAGGALGGAFVSIVAPLIFTRNLEFFIAMFGTIALLLVRLGRDPQSSLHQSPHRLAALGGMLALALVAGLLIRLRISEAESQIVLRTRNFYGCLSLSAVDSDKVKVQYRKLMHGRIDHGAQHYTPDRPDIRRWPTTYYGLLSGAGLLLQPENAGPNVAAPPPRRVGVVGLGAGTLATYALPGDVFRFYEINPQVAQFAEEFFTFLSDARARGATVDVVLNDARLELEREQPQKFDVLVLDAFSGDAIPVHLLTREAFETYSRHLADDGAIAVHVTNRYLDLHPIVQRVAESLNFKTVIVDSPPDHEKLLNESHWVIATRSEAVLNLPALQRHGVRPASPSQSRLWTDDYCSLLDALRW